MWVERRLAALGYPRGDHSFDVNDLQHLQALVAWLEDTKIRFLPVNDRQPLRDPSPNWLSTFKEYLQKLGCPHKVKEPFEGVERLTILDWILSHAIGLAYRDNAESLSEQAQSFQDKSKPADTSDYSSPQFKEALAALANILQIPLHDDPDTLLNTIQKTVRAKFSEPSLAALGIGNDNNNNNNNDSKLSATYRDTSISDEKFPLGFDTGEKQVNTVATILRLLYIRDLRELQTNINDLIVAVQAFTANPVTNTLLGKVGR